MDRWTLAGMAPPIALLSAWPCAASGKAGTMETKGETKAATGPGPRLDQFVPTAGAPGDPVLITGAGLAETTGVSFGKAPAAGFFVMDDNRLYTLVPPGAATGRIGVADGKGRSRFGAAFTVRQHPPTLVQISPHHGPPGTEVLLVGTSFTPDLKAVIGGAEAQVTVQSLTRAVAVVPKDAKDGPVAVATSAGKATGPRDFWITEARAGLHLEVAGVMLTQGSQTPDLRVPLVADRDGFLAVTVLADRPNHEAPVVRVRLRDDHGEELLARDLPAPAAGVPRQVDPGDLASQWTLPIDGKYLRPGTRLRVELFPQGTQAGSGKLLAKWPPGSDGYEPLRIEKVPPLEIFLIPVIQDGLTPELEGEGRRLEDWTAFFRALYPVAEVRVAKGEPLHCTGTLKPDNPETWHDMARQVEAQRVRDGRSTTQFYYGVVRTRHAYGLLGYGLEGVSIQNDNRSAIGTDDPRADYPGGPARYQRLLAHELGHVFTLTHAPCSLPGGLPLEGVDEKYPYPGADIGAFGFDLATRAVKAPGGFKDIMSYCPPYWISDHNYLAALIWLTYLEKHR